MAHILGLVVLQHIRSPYIILCLRYWCCDPAVDCSLVLEESLAILDEDEDGQDVQSGSLNYDYFLKYINSLQI